MTYTLTVAYYDGPAITSDYDDREEAMVAWDDTLWAAAHGPKDQIGDIRAVTLRQDDRVLQTRAW